MSINVPLGALDVPFDLWRPGDVLVGLLIAVDTETELLRPGAVPRLVVATATDGQRGVFIAAQHVGAFLAAHTQAQFIMHNAAFDIPVMEAVGAEFNPVLDQRRVHDTGLLYRLMKLADTGNCRGPWSLDYLAEELLKTQVSKNVLACDGQDVRTTFGRFILPDGSVDYRNLLSEPNRPYLQYAAKDPIATLLIARALNERAQHLFGCTLNVFDRQTYSVAGVIDFVDVGSAWQRYGFLTHDIQLLSSLALASIERRGMNVDRQRAAEVHSQLEHNIEEATKLLKSLGWSPGKGSLKSYETIMAKVEKALGEPLPRADAGGYSRKGDDLEEYRHRSSFVDAYLRFQEISKIQSTFVDALANSNAVVRGHFNVLVNTGRTSCSAGKDDNDEQAGLNLQTLPREGPIRECLIPPEGHFLLAIDYTAIELTTLAQHCIKRYGFSDMGDAIKRGADLHALDAAVRAGIDVSSLQSWDKKTLMPLLGPDADKLRDKSKAKNFGLPGGLGARTFCNYAKNSYGVELTENEARQEKVAWLQAFPEMKLHLESSDLQILTQQFPEIWRSYPRSRPHSQVQGIPPAVHVFKGILCGQTSTKSRQRPYDSDEIDWAWTSALRVLEAAPLLNVTSRAVLETQIRERMAGVQLWQALAPRQRYVSTLTGRLRGYPTYCAARNCVFQGLAADGAKLALYWLEREGFKPVNFIHDEGIFLLPINADHLALALRIEQLFQYGMGLVVPDLPIKCEFALMRRWFKGAKKLILNGKLLPVRPHKNEQGQVNWVEDMPA